MASSYHKREQRFKTIMYGNGAWTRPLKFWFLTENLPKFTMLLLCIIRQCAFPDKMSSGKLNYFPDWVHSKWLKMFIMKTWITLIALCNIWRIIVKNLRLSLPIETFPLRHNQGNLLSILSVLRDNENHQGFTQIYIHRWQKLIYY